MLTPTPPPPTRHPAPANPAHDPVDAGREVLLPPGPAELMCDWVEQLLPDCTEHSPRTLIEQWMQLDHELHAWATAYILRNGAITPSGSPGRRPRSVPVLKTGQVGRYIARVAQDVAAGHLTAPVGRALLYAAQLHIAAHRVAPDTATTAQVNAATPQNQRTAATATATAKTKAA